MAGAARSHQGGGRSIIGVSQPVSWNISWLVGDNLLDRKEERKGSNNINQLK